MTELIYLQDTYLFTLEARAQELIYDDFGEALVLDKTIFYPQGGGQPSDSGEIVCDKFVFEVSKVRLTNDGLVMHYGEFSSGGWVEGSAVELKIDAVKRLVHAKVHSAGHLLDCAVSSLGLNQLSPTKGFHFPEGPYVEYEGILEESSSWIAPLEKKINELVLQDLEIQGYLLSAEQAANQGVWAPEGKSARVVSFDGFQGCGCGGTHVSSTKEIGDLIIRKIKVKKGVTRIAYALK